MREVLLGLGIAALVLALALACLAFIGSLYSEADAAENAWEDTL
jgi:hypothetical protein